MFTGSRTPEPLTPRRTIAAVLRSSLPIAFAVAAHRIILLSHRFRSLPSPQTMHPMAKMQVMLFKLPTRGRTEIKGGAQPLMESRAAASIFLGATTSFPGALVKRTNSRKSSLRLQVAGAVVSVAAVVGLGAGTQIARAAIVSGTMSYRDGSPATRRQLHYENVVTSDIYVAPTKPDGSFSADLPPGVYDLRAERGVVLAGRIHVNNQDVNVGHVVEPAPLDFRRPFEHEGVAEAIVDNPAPATANITSGRPIEGMKYGHEALAPFGAPVGTPAPRETPLGEATPVAAASPTAVGSPGLSGY
jgi:hypothetical protein